MAESLCKDQKKRGTAYDQHRKPLDFVRSTFGGWSFRKANHSEQKDPLLPTENERLSMSKKRTLEPTPTNQNSMSFGSSLPAFSNEVPQKKDQFSTISGKEMCQTLDSHMGNSSGISLFHQPCAVAGQQWTDKCLGLTDTAGELRTTAVCTAAYCAQLCDMPPVQQVACCAGQWNSDLLEQKDSDCKRVCIEWGAPELSASQYVMQLNEISGFAKHSNSLLAAATCPDLAVSGSEQSVVSLGSCYTNVSVQQTEPPAESGARILPSKVSPPQVKRLKLFTKAELKEKANHNLMMSTDVPINTVQFDAFHPRLSTEDEFNCSTIPLPSKKIFIGRLFTQASDVKVGPLAFTANLSAANFTHNLKIDIKDIKEWKGHFNSEPFVMALTVVPGICHKLVNVLSVKFRLNSCCKFYNSGSASTVEKYIVIPMITPLNERQAVTLRDIIEQQKGPREVEINFTALAPVMHELLHDVIANQLDPMNPLEETKNVTIGNQLEAVVSLEEKKKDTKSVNLTIVTRKTRSSQKQSSIPEQSSMRQEPLCADEHKKLLIYNPFGSKLHFEITGGDLNCLHPHEYLNDKIINFYLTYLLCDKFVNIKERVHIFSSFFLGKLMESPKDRKRSLEDVHDRVKSWTRHVDIFSKEYIVMPVCLRSHWFVAIVCFPEKFDPSNKPSRQPSKLSQQSDTVLDVDSEESVGDGVLTILSIQDQLKANPTSSSTRPCIIVLDSLGIRRHVVLQRIRSYLAKEWKVKRTTEKNFSSMPPLYPSVPLQINNFDCGIYVLQYVEGFLKSVASSSSLPQSQEEWASYEDLSQKRQSIRTLIETLSERGII